MKLTILAVVSAHEDQEVENGKSARHTTNILEKLRGGLGAPRHSEVCRWRRGDRSLVPASRVPYMVVVPYMVGLLLGLPGFGSRGLLCTPQKNHVAARASSYPATERMLPSS